MYLKSYFVCLWDTVQVTEPTYRFVSNLNQIVFSGWQWFLDDEIGSIPSYGESRETMTARHKWLGILTPLLSSPVQEFSSGS